MGAFPSARRPLFWGVVSAHGGPSTRALLRAYFPLCLHQFSQGEATDPWAPSRSASWASLATSSAGRRWLARSCAFRGFRSADWGSPGGRIVERAGAVRAAGVSSAAARRGLHGGDRRRGRETGVHAERGGGATVAVAGSADSVTRGCRGGSVRSSSRAGECWRVRASRDSCPISLPLTIPALMELTITRVRRRCGSTSIRLV